MEELKQENERLKQQLSSIQQELDHYKNAVNEGVTFDEIQELTKTTKLSKEQISRYGRQLLLPDFGVKGQIALLNTSILVVGAGGLGCPVALYLAAAGIGRLGIIDYDVVDSSNLHRQVVHTEESVGVPKALSIKNEILNRNSKISCVAYKDILTSENALRIIKSYDVIVDASDNVATRYLINDACVMTNKPLISGSALKWEGQVTVYNYKGGPCYRCLFPVPPPPETVTRCSDGGVMGAVTGIIGCTQAIEAIKVASNVGETLSGKLLLFDGQYGTFRTVKLRPKQPACVVCGENPTVTRLIDYPEFCGAPYSDKAGNVEDEIDKTLIIDCEAYSEIFREKLPHVLLDVREEVQFNICSLPNAFNIPLEKLETRLDELKSKLADFQNIPVYVICRRGWDSQTAVELLHSKGIPNTYHITGGLTSWAETVDPDFPIY